MNVPIPVSRKTDSTIYGLMVIYTDLYTYFQNQKADYHYFEMKNSDRSLKTLKVLLSSM